MRRIELPEYLLIAEDITGTPAQVLAGMSRVVKLAEAALAAPFAGFGDFEAHPSIEEKAAVYCSRIVRYHALPDGNKRVGYAVMRMFLSLNGVAFEHPAGGLEETALMIETLAAAMISEEEFTIWVFERTGRSPEAD